MADKLVITGIHKKLDGEYDFDGSYFTNREWHDIKRLSGVRAGEIEDALEAGDTDVVLALAVVTLKRAGKTAFEDMLWDAEAGGISIQLEETEEEAEADDAGPPELTSPENESSPTTSGESSRQTSAPPVNGQSPTGTPGSGDAVASDRVTSAS